MVNFTLELVKPQLEQKDMSVFSHLVKKKKKFQLSGDNVG